MCLDGRYKDDEKNMKNIGLRTDLHSHTKMHDLKTKLALATIARNNLSYK